MRTEARRLGTRRANGLAARARVISEMYLPEDLFSPESWQYYLDQIHLLPTNELLSLLIKNNFTLKVFKKYFHEWRFIDVHKLIEFHMTHMKGVFDKTHFYGGVQEALVKGKLLSSYHTS